MRREHLQWPFSWEERRVLVQDRVWYVPDYIQDYNTFSFPGWDHPCLFGNTHPVKVEYCSGNGAWIIDKATSHPQINWLAVEWNFGRVGKIWSKLKKLRLDNLVVLCGEGYLATKHYFPSASISEAFINFPDPWPKKRHAKHRLIQLPFVEEIKRILFDKGCITMVTDDPVYSSELIQTMQDSTGFDSCYPFPHYITEYPEYGTSYFENLWRNQGRDIRYHQFRHAKIAGRHHDR